MKAINLCISEIASNTTTGGDSFDKRWFVRKEKKKVKTSQIFFNISYTPKLYLILHVSIIRKVDNAIDLKTRYSVNSAVCFLKKLKTEKLTVRLAD